MSKVSPTGAIVVEVVRLRARLAQLEPQVRRITYLQQLVKELGDENVQLRRQVYGGTRIKKGKRHERLENTAE